MQGAGQAGCSPGRSARLLRSRPGSRQPGDRAHFARLVLGCMEADVCNRLMRLKALAEIYTIHTFAQLGSPKCSSIVANMLMNLLCLMFLLS